MVASSAADAGSSALTVGPFPGSSPRKEIRFMKPIVRHLRLHCATPTANPIPGSDGILAVAAIKESAGLARLLLVDMDAWGRNDGASMTHAAGAVVHAAHRRLIGGFGIPLLDTICVELDRSGYFDLLLDVGDGAGLRRSALMVGDRSVPARSREAFLRCAGEVGRQMLRTVDAVREGEWVGAEG